jgi:hypothetical protein
MEGDLHFVDFVDYHAVFCEALARLGKGMSVSEAIESSLKERYPLTYKEIDSEARSILSRLKQERDWGSVRALRELADRPELAEKLRVPRKTPASSQAAGRSAAPEPVADYRRIFSLAQRKRQAGFSLEDSLEMAVRELYPQTFRKVKDTALSYVRLSAQRLGVHELRALHELAENPQLISECDQLATD